MRLRKRSHLFFIITALTVLFCLAGSSIAYAQLMFPLNGFVDRPTMWNNTGYGYGYWSDGTVGYGYNTYRQPYSNPNSDVDPFYNPVKDTDGLYANGTLLKLKDDNTVYLVQEGALRGIFSPSVFNSWGFDWNAIKTVSLAELYSYGMSEIPILGFRAGTLVKVPREPGIYVVDFLGLFDLIPDMNTFNAYGFDMNAVMEVPLPELQYFGFGDQIPFPTVDGPIPTVLGFPTGLPFKGSGPQVYVMDVHMYEISGNTFNFTPAIWQIMSPAAFESWNFSWNGILTMSDYELSSWLGASGFKVQDMWLQPGTLVKSPDDPGVYVSDYLAVQSNQPEANPMPEYQFVRRCIVSPTIFDSQGYLWSSIMTEDANVLSSITRGRDIMSHTRDFSNSSCDTPGCHDGNVSPYLFGRI